MNDYIGSILISRIKAAPAEAGSSTRFAWGDLEAKGVKLASYFLSKHDADKVQQRAPCHFHSESSKLIGSEVGMCRRYRQNPFQAYMCLAKPLCQYLHVPLRSMTTISLQPVHATTIKLVGDRLR